MDTNCAVHWIEIYPVDRVIYLWITRACKLLSVIQTNFKSGRSFVFSPENIRNQSYIKFPHSFVSRKSTKKLTSEGDCLRYKSWGAGQFHIQNLLSTEKKMTERVPHLTWTFYGWRLLLRCIQPSCIDSVPQNKKKDCNMRKWALMTE